MPVPFLGRAIRRRHSAVDKERGGHVIARHIFDLQGLNGVNRFYFKIQVFF